MASALDLIKSAQIALKLRAIRKSVDYLYGDRALQELEPFMEVLRGLHQKTGKPYLELCLEVAEDMTRKGLPLQMVMAATFELIEPSQPVVPHA